MTLSEAQRDFTFDIALLVIWVYEELGYELTYGDAYRSPKVHGDQGEQGPYGKAWSAHKQRLAVDFNLFIDGVYQEDTEAWREIGMKWESISGDNVWGGRFDDGNHLSKRYNGIA